MPSSASRRDANPSDPGPTWRLFAIPALVALVGYMILYGVDSRMRSRRGPWEVTFYREAGDVPALNISQPRLGLTNVTVRFLGETLQSDAKLPAVVRFDEPLKAIPFGRTAFDDLMYQPGTVVLHCFGHEVQMLPRALFLNRQEQAWVNGRVFELSPTGKLASLEPPKRLRER